MVSKRKIGTLWVVWLLVWPTILWFSYHNYYIHIDQIFDIILFAVFMVLVSYFPLKINNYQVFFTNGISMVVFLMFGLFVEIILVQIVIVIVLINVGVRFKDSYRFPLNMLSIALVSLVSAEVFYLAGGSHGAMFYESPTQLFATVLYGLSIIFFNLVFNKIIERFFYNRRFRIFGDEDRWEFMTLLFVLPVGYVLYILYAEIGTAGIFYLGVPFVFISIIIQLLYSHQELNNYLSKTSMIGHLLTKNLLKEEVYDIFMEELKELIKTDYIRVFIEEEGELKLVRFYNFDQSMTPNKERLRKNNAFSKIVWETEEPLFFTRSKEWRDFVDPGRYKDIESVISLPIEYDNEIIGVVTVASRQKYKFEKFHVEILDILTTYLGIAIQNAKNHELTKLESSIDGLTQIYNYKYFENVISSYEENLHLNEEISHYSVILLDIDLFKQVNDTYGHEAGNEILHELASRLSMIVEDKGLLARFGGEEFAIFLPDFTAEKARKVANEIRDNIKERNFIVRNHILDQTEPQEVAITVSIGIATYPDHCESLLELIRHADRAMYVGAKNKGRDRIALYGENE